MAVSRLRIVVFPDTPKTWTARSLERDLSAGGRTPEAAIDTLVRIAEAHIAFDTRHGREPLSAFTSAPQLFWNAFAKSEKRPESLELHVHGCPSENALHCVVGVAPQNPLMTRSPRSLRIA